MTQMENVVKEYIALWNTGNVQELHTVVAADAVYKDALQEGNALALLQNSIASTHLAFPNIIFKTLSFSITNHDKGLLEWVMKGTNTGSFFGANPTGKEIEIAGVDIISVDGDKITEIKSFYDSSLFATQLEI